MSKEMKWEEKVTKEFEEWFDKEAYFLQFSLVPPKSEIDKVVKGWMEEAYLQACKVRKNEYEKIQFAQVDHLMEELKRKEEEIEKLKKELENQPRHIFDRSYRSRE